MKQAKDKNSSSVLGENIINTLVEAVLPEDLSPERRLALRSRIADRRLALRSRVLDSAQQKTEFITVRSQEGEWVTVAPGVSKKLLHRSGTIHSFLFRLAPGAVVPAHEHEVDEECLILEGDAVLGGINAGPGDYQWAPKGTRHSAITSQGGALMFVRYGRSADQTTPQ